MDWTNGYECLREHALGGPAPSNDWLSSLTVLLQNGVAAWLRCGANPTRTHQFSIPQAWLQGGHRETTLLLAEMILPQFF